MNLEEMKNIYNKSLGVKSHLEKKLTTVNEEYEGVLERLHLLEQAQVFLQEVAQKTQEHLRIQIEDIVNLALDVCFPEEYLFEVLFETARGKTEARLKFTDKRTGKEVDPMNASGGGVVDLTCFALRIACYALQKETDNVIILDEPFRFLSRDLQSRAGQIIRTLSEKMNIQILMVTHIPEMIDIADKVFEVEKKKGVSIVKEI